MRVSVIKGDVGYTPMAMMFEVLFNGELLNECFIADEEKGEAYVYKLDENGRPMLNKTLSAPEFEVLKGRVQIVIKWREIK